MSCLSTYSSLAGAGGFGARCITSVARQTSSWSGFLLCLASTPGYCREPPDISVVFPKCPARGDQARICAVAHTFGRLLGLAKTSCYHVSIAVQCRKNHRAVLCPITNIDAMACGAFNPVAQPAERLTTLDNKRVAFVWDTCSAGKRSFR